MRNVYLRADANAEIGSGHVSRMIALGEMLSSHFHVILISKQDVEAPIATLVIENENEFLALLNEHAIAVLDGYHFDGAFQKAIREKGTKLVCIDDHQHQEYYADLVINHAPGVSPEVISGRHYTRYLTGTKYALLNKLFLELPTPVNVRKSRSVLICFGGSDIHDLSYSITKHVLAIEEVESIHVILGRDYKGKCDTLLDSRLEISSGLTALQMRDMMRKHEIAIVSSSTILFECLSQGLRCISGYYTSNQTRIYKGFLAAKAIVGLGDLSECLPGEVQEVISLTINDVKCVNIEGIFDEQIQERLISEFQLL